MVRSKNAGRSSDDELVDKDVGVFDVTLLVDEFDENLLAFSEVEEMFDVVVVDVFEVTLVVDEDLLAFSEVEEMFDEVVVGVFDENRAASTSISIQSFWNDSRSPK
jgi:hypothetical protein